MKTQINESYEPGLQDLKKTQNQDPKNPSTTKLTGSFNAGLRDLKAVATQDKNQKNK